jgi:hypothetical protein
LYEASKTQTRIDAKASWGMSFFHNYRQDGTCRYDCNLYANLGAEHCSGISASPDLLCINASAHSVRKETRRLVIERILQFLGILKRGLNDFILIQSIHIMRVVSENKGCGMGNMMACELDRARGEAPQHGSMSNESFWASFYWKNVPKNVNLLSVSVLASLWDTPQKCLSGPKNT